MIKYRAAVKLAAQEAAEDGNPYFGQGVIKSFEIGETSISGVDLDRANISEKLSVIAKRKKDDTEGYFEESYLELDGFDDDEPFASPRRTRLFDDEDVDLSELHEEDIAEHGISSPEQDPEFKKVLEQDKTSSPTQDRINLIRERAEALRKKKEMDAQEASVPALQEEVIEQAEDVAPQAGSVAVEKDESLEDDESDDESDDELDEVEEIESGDSKSDEDELDGEEEPKKRGRKKGQTSEGRQFESDIPVIDELRMAAYDIDFLNSYGINEKKMDQMFDVQNYIDLIAKTDPKKARKIQSSSEEPELWEMAEPHIDAASKEEKREVENLIESAYNNLAKLKMAESDYDAEKAGASDKKSLKAKEKIKSTIEKLRDNEVSTFSGIELFNKLEAAFFRKYFSKLRDKLEKKASEIEERVEGLKEKKEEEKSDQELAQKILKKEKQ
jgi:hypothetical protein